MKKICSVTLLCLTIVSFLLLVLLLVDTGISVYQLENMEIDSSNDTFPLESVVGLTVSAFAIWGGCLFFGLVFVSIGFFSSLINKKIAANQLISRVSTAFLYVNSVSLLLVIGTSVCGAIF